MKNFMNFFASDPGAPKEMPAMDWKAVCYRFNHRLDSVQGYGDGMKECRNEWDGITSKGVKFRVERKCRNVTKQRI
jgi:hypothetical protein